MAARRSAAWQAMANLPVRVARPRRAKFLGGLREQVNLLIEQSMNEWQHVGQGEALGGRSGDLARDWSGSTGQEEGGCGLKWELARKSGSAESPRVDSAKGA
jgi:hypothetical protein